MTHTAVVVDMTPNRQSPRSPARDATAIHRIAAPALYNQDPLTGHPQESEMTTETPGAGAESLALTSEAATAAKEDIASVATVAVGAPTRIEFQKKDVLRPRMLPVTVIINIVTDLARYAKLRQDALDRTPTRVPTSLLENEV